MLKLFSICAVVVLLVACGNKGALYLPSDVKAPQQHSPL
ncbi:lipoprotein [Marinomonas sp. C2222]|uniref:Lipoprotein n=1 Tax=Marinomonas sargassi TaxID=2984494 RepID=A0ABT2YUY7_9GAMM|nr:lipoprotein [Marinomonas sargassi]MCV2403706.1 lipoprotein [Marinomonas sargassi]